MLYDADKKEKVLDTLNDRVSSIVDVCTMLLNEGFVVNKAKLNKLNMCIMLIHAFENIDVLSVKQHNNIELLYNKVIML